MRPRHPILVVGFASSVAATTAVLPSPRPLETDPVMLLIVWTTTAFAGSALARIAQGRVVTVLTALLTLACLLTIGVEAVHQRRGDRPSLLLVLLGISLACSAATLSEWLCVRVQHAVPTDVAALVAGPLPHGSWRLKPPVASGPTRPLPSGPAEPRRILHDRWLLEPGPLAGADKGGFSVLCRAIDLRQRARTVVVKLASRAFGIEDGSVARLLRESELVGGLHSPYVVGLLDSGWEAGAFFLVLEYHPAGSLARWLERRFVLELALAIGAARELLRALVYLHDDAQWPVIHRDVTPRNVLVRAEQPALRVLLTDFGSARRLDAQGPTLDAGITTGSVFSPYYAPPELVGGAHHGWWGPETDIYGACAILYELLTGLPPYQREARQQHIEFQRLVLDPTTAPGPPSRITRGLPPILDDVLAVGLADDPSARFARAADLLPLLEEIGRRYGTLRIPFADLRGSGAP